MVNVPVGLGDTDAPTATRKIVTRSFSMSASLRSGMLTTIRRDVAGAVETPSSAVAGTPAARTTIAIARVRNALLVAPMSCASAFRVGHEQPIGHPLTC